MASAIHYRRAQIRVRRHRRLGSVWRGFTYDANGNLDQTTDALTRVTDNNVDQLNRLSRSLQDMAGIAAETQFGYDALSLQRLPVVQARFAQIAKELGVP